MASTFTCLNYHVVFSTKYRRNTIAEQLRDDLYSYIGGIIRAEKGCLHEIGGTANHVHMLIAIPPAVAVSDMIRIVKANSSKWVNERQTQTKQFRWQTGYGAFSVSCSLMESVRQYIQNQEEHHRERTFEDEFLEILNRHKIEYDLQYVFEEEIVG